jgi:hypothetical protein
MASTSTAALATLATAAMRASCCRGRRGRRSSRREVGGQRGDDGVAVEVAPLAISASRVRRIISPSVSLVLTIAWTLAS